MMSGFHHTPGFHPTDEALMGYAAGGQSEAMSLIVATHLALCPECRAKVRTYEAVGGAMLDDIPPAPKVATRAEDLLAMLDQPNADAPVAVQAPIADPRVPEPLRGYLNGGLDNVVWKSFGKGFAMASVPVAEQNSRARAWLLKVQPGRKMPKHTHDADEMVLVLTGSFHDKNGHYARGDMVVADDGIEHQPVADEESECICLSVIDGPLRLTGAIGRLFNPLLRF